MAQNLIPKRAEMALLLANIKRGDVSGASRFIRGCVYAGAIEQGKTEQEARTLAMAPELAGAQIKLEAA